MSKTSARPLVRSDAFMLPVIALAVVLRFWAIDRGAPYLYHPDEHLVLHPALNIVRTGDLNPHWFQYPSLLIYLQAGVVAVLRPFVDAPLTTDPAVNHIGPWDAVPAQWPFALGGRLVVAGFAVLGAWLLYRVGAGYAQVPVGVAAALFLVSSPLHNESSHSLTTDVPAATLLTAALLFSVRGAQSLELQPLAVAGFFAGLAAGTKYTAGIVLLVPLLVALSVSLRASAQRVAAILTTAAAGFLLACPFALLDFAAVWQGMMEQRHNYLRGYNPGGNWRWYLFYLYDVGLGRPLAVMGVLGLLGALVRIFAAGTSWAERRLNAALIAVPMSYFVLVSSYPSRAERNLIILLPFVCLLGADVGWRAVRRLGSRTLGQCRIAVAGFALVVLLVAAPSIVACVRYDRRLAQPDTRTLALQWIEANIPVGARIAREEYTPQVSGDRYKVTYVWSLAFQDYATYLVQPVDYLVVSSNVYGRALYPPYVAGAAGRAFYQFLFARLPLEAEFTPSADRPGPTIRIYRVPHP